MIAILVFYWIYYIFLEAAYHQFIVAYLAIIVIEGQKLQMLIEGFSEGESFHQDVTSWMWKEGKKNVEVNSVPFRLI